ncbi:MAG: hypothetical protein LUF04_06870 [Bacteroides sp.]|nr:hypothetical protein [Bacteroides sp.]
MRKNFGNSAHAAATIYEVAGFKPHQYSNEPQSADEKPWDANPITNWEEDDGKAGENYSGTGKLSSSTPQQVIVTISNLLSIQTIQRQRAAQTAYGLLNSYSRYIKYWEQKELKKRIKASETSRKNGKSQYAKLIHGTEAGRYG